MLVFFRLREASGDLQDSLNQVVGSNEQRSNLRLVEEVLEFMQPAQSL